MSPILDLSDVSPETWAKFRRVARSIRNDYRPCKRGTRLTQEDLEYALELMVKHYVKTHGDP